MVMGRTFTKSMQIFCPHPVQRVARPHMLCLILYYEVKLPRDEATQASRYQSFIRMFSNRVISSGCFMRRMINIVMSHSGRHGC